MFAPIDWKISTLLGVVALVAGDAGVVGWKRFVADAEAAPVKPTADGTRLQAKTDQERMRAANKAKKLRQEGRLRNLWRGTEGTVSEVSGRC